MTELTPTGFSTNSPVAPRLRDSSTGHPALISLLLVALVAAVFYPTLRCQFVDLDDPIYVSANPHVQGGLTAENVAWALRAGYASNWHPLTWMSHQLDVQLYGLNPAGHHLTNLFLHAFNSALLFLVLRRLTGAQWQSAFVAVLFALHPLHVESVAWVSERKDLLSAFFFFLTLLAYTRYAEIQRLEAVGRIGKGQESKDRFQSAVRSPWSYIHFPASSCYVLALLFLALGLMSKPMLVTTPFVLLLLDYWPLRRFALNPQLSTLRLLWQLLCEKLPFLLLSLLSCLVTVVAQKGAIQPLTNISLTGRLSNALVAYVRYLDKTFWPFDLATPYPYPSHWPVTSVMLATALLAMVSAAALGFSRRYPYLVTGWFWFLGMLVPVIGLVQVGEQSMADRYTYLPLIGIFILLTWGVAQSSGPATNQAEVATDPRSMRRAFLGIAAVLVLLAGSVRTRDQLRCWQDGDSLSRHAIAVTENNWIAYFDLGSSLDAKGQVDQALTNYLEALKLQPQYPDPLNNIGCILAGRRQFSQAIPYFAAALRSSPGFVNAHDNLAHSLCELGRFNEAIPHFQTVLTANPEDKTASDSLAGAHFQVGRALAAQGKTAEATSHLTKALRLNPHLTQARVLLQTLPSASVKE